MEALNGWFYKQIAIVATLFGRPAIALEYWERIRSLRPRDPHVLASVAHMRASAGERDTAITLLQDAVAIDARQPAMWFNLGYLLQESGRHDEAIIALDRAIALDDKLDRAFYGKAISLLKTDRVDAAIPLLLKNTELQPLSPFGFYQLAHAYHRQGATDKVARTIRKLATFEPKVAKQLEQETGVVVGVDTGFWRQ